MSKDVVDDLLRFPTSETHQRAAVEIGRLRRDLRERDYHIERLTARVQMLEEVKCYTVPIRGDVL